MAELEKIEKEKRIKKEIAKYNKIFRVLDEERKKAVQKLIENVAFMAITLEDLQQSINEKGFVESYQNGNNQHGYKESSAVRVYNSMIKNYNTSIKQILDQMPENETVKEDEFDKFLDKK